MYQFVLITLIIVPTKAVDKRTQKNNKLIVTGPVKRHKSAEFNRNDLK